MCTHGKHVASPPYVRLVACTHEGNVASPPYVRLVACAHEGNVASPPYVRLFCFSFLRLKFLHAEIILAPNLIPPYFFYFEVIFNLVKKNLLDVDKFTETIQLWYLIDIP